VLVLTGAGAWRAFAVRTPIRATGAAQVLEVGQHELTATGRLPVRVTAASRGRLRLAATLVASDGARVPLVRSGWYFMNRRAVRTFTLTLPPHARSALAVCRSARLEVAVLPVGPPRRSRRTAAEPLRLDPPECAPFFAAGSPWNTPLGGDAPLDATSPQVVAELARSVQDGWARGVPPAINTTAYSAPIETVPSGQDLVAVKLDQPPSWVPDLRAAFAQVPVPSSARPAPGTDGHMIVWQPGTERLWEFWRMQHQADGWHAEWGGFTDRVRSALGVFTGTSAAWGATATGLSLAGGLITLAELRRGKIEHALALAVPNARRGAFARPAQHSDGVGTAQYAVPEGARFRLDPRIDVDALRVPPVTKMIARAAQRYGLIVRDQGAGISLFAEDPSPYGKDPYPGLFGGQASWDLLRGFPWSSLQLLRMDLVQGAGGGGLGSGLCPVFRC
jgi:hypothetical protein